MLSSSHNEKGFSLLEALLALLIGAALMAMLFDVLAADALQTRNLITRNERSASILRAHREYLAAATAAEGKATAQRAGDLTISQGRLELASRTTEPLLAWTRGQGRLDYSTDGRTWQVETNDADRDLIRFTWKSGNQELVWIAP